MKSLNKILTAQANKKRDALTQGIEQALEWLEDNRQQAPRLNMEADRLAVKLLRQHNKASVLARNTLSHCAIGLFGLAQAGKGYLIGALAASEKGRLECALGNSVMDYASQLNPQQHTANLVDALQRQAAEQRQQLAGAARPAERNRAGRRSGDAVCAAG